MPYKDPEVQRQYQLDWALRRRRQWIAENGPCAECGSWEDLEVDHVDGKTKVDHKVWNWRLERRLVELAKCQVLCQPCHYTKTGRERTSEGEQCPSRTAYRKGCRCEGCRGAQAAYMREFRAQRRLRVSDSNGVSGL